MESEKQKLKAVFRASHVRLRKEAHKTENLDRGIEFLEKAQGTMITHEAQSLEQEDLVVQMSQSNVIKGVVFDERELVTLLAFLPDPGSGDDNSQVS